MNLLLGEYFRFFFLDTELDCNRISYAASFGVSNQPEEKRILFSPLLKQFDAISVRDDFSRDIVASTGCNPPIVVCDPTLIHDFSDIIEKPDMFDQLPTKYIFTYCLNKENESDYVEVLSRLKNELKLPIVSITSYGHTNWELVGCDNYIRTATPGEWVYLLANAQFVFTDSFHGTIFSLKYKRPFLSYSHQSTRGDRTKDLAKRYKFEERLVSRASLSKKLLKTSDQDFEITYTLLKEHQKMSVEWLLKHGVNPI
jgi:polysaccharide pyruvyl transferase WcaK-like protein